MKIRSAFLFLNLMLVSISRSGEVRHPGGPPERKSAGDTQAAAPADGAALLEDCIASPGDYNQMCMLPELLPPTVPMPFGASLVPRHFNLDPKNIRRLQANRNLVIPVLAERLRTMRMETPAAEIPRVREDYGMNRSGQDGRSFGPLLLQVVEVLNAVECLPDLLRLEQELSGLIAKAESDAAVQLPDLDLDSPSGQVAVMMLEQEFSDSADSKGRSTTSQDTESPQAVKRRERAMALIGCKIYQRELLGLIKTLLKHEDYAPIKSSTFVKTQRAEGRKRLVDTAAAIKSEDDLHPALRPFMSWDSTAGKAVIADGVVMPVQIPYTAAIRNEIRSLAEAFLKEVPPEKRKAGAGMPASGQ